MEYPYNIITIPNEDWMGKKVTIFTNGQENGRTYKLTIDKFINKITSSDVLKEQTDIYKKLIKKGKIDEANEYRDNNIPLVNFSLDYENGVHTNTEKKLNKTNFIAFNIHEPDADKRMKLNGELLFDEFILFGYDGLNEDEIVGVIILEEDYELSKIKDELELHFQGKYNYKSFSTLDLEHRIFIGYSNYVSSGNFQKYFDTKKIINFNEKSNSKMGNGIFWEESYNKDGELSVSIIPTKLHNIFSDEGGFFFSALSYYETEKTYFLQTIDNGLKESSIEDVLFFTGDYLRRLLFTTEVKELVMNQLLTYTSKFFSEDKLKLGLLKKDVNFIKDSSKVSYHCFRNFLLKVSADGYETIQYDDLDSFYWSQRKIYHNIEIIDDEKASECMFNQFLKNLCTKRETATFEEDRYLALKRSIGYCLHRFKDPINNKVIIFSEDNLSISASGRSGKGLIMKAISKLMKVVIENGKNFDANAQFSFSRITPTTDMLFIDDVPRFFKFDDYFSLVTEGLIIENKGVDKKFLDFANSPKITISSNYNVQGDDGSNLDRRYEMELCSYYSAHYKPHHEFNCRFFMDWDSEEWNKFYVFMLSCLKDYFASGCELPEYNSSIETKKIISVIGERYYYYAKEKLPINTFISTVEHHEGFLDFYGLDEADKGPKGFRDKAKLFAKHMGYEFKAKKKSDKRGFEFQHHVIKSVPLDDYSFDVEIDLSDLEDVE